MKRTGGQKELSGKEREALFQVLMTRFKEHKDRHRGVLWSKVQAKLESQPAKLFALYEMERTGGQPDVVRYDKKTDEFTFFDCSPESPKGRVAVCYDRTALESRKEHKPKDTAVDMAAAMGVEILTEDQYHELQKLGEFDTRTTTWLKTPPEIRELGGALFGDRRFGRVFVYHNGAQSYYSARGFRSALIV